ncbi:MAG: DNA translocase FtsK [Anaerolineaceae bacterium]|nr:DNA translocase FtsK [Anaerolineaceae bacterium]
MATRKNTKSSRRTSTKKKSRTTKLSASQKLQQLLDNISREQRIDFLGYFLTLLAVLTILSFFTSQRGSITEWWVHTLRLGFGWGAFILPIGLLLVGVWIVIRHLENLPPLSLGRVLGMGSLFLNSLTWMHLFTDGGWIPAANGIGGGYLGGAFEQLMFITIGKPAAIVITLAWFFLSILLTFELSFPELYMMIRDAIETNQDSQKKQNATRVEKTSTSTLKKPVEKTESNSTPAKRQQQPLQNIGFEPLSALNQKPVSAAQQEPASVPPVTEQNSEAILPDSPIVDIGIKTSQLAKQSDWKIPRLDEILNPASPIAQQTSLDEDNAHLIEETLASFGAPVHVVEIHRGPSVTQYGIEPDYIETRNGRTRVRVNKITNLADDLALALAAKSIRIQAPVPGKSYIGIEVPNIETSPVTLREVFVNSSFKKLHSKLRFALGMDVAGKPVAAALDSLPHLLIAGTTGSGKSVCINTVLCSLLLNNTPEDLRLVLVDPKRVELTGYNNIPHLLAPVITDADKVVGALKWILREMDSRYHKFAKCGVRNISEYNKQELDDHLPYIVTIVDELADLMMLAPDETERAITRLAQLARATGIHLILATQRPSTDVVTGLIKANFPARIAFAVASNIDSRVILDQPGAERLLGRGDMLFLAPDAPAPVRLQGVFVSDQEIRKLIAYWKNAAAENGREGLAVPGAEGPVDMPDNSLPLKQIALWDEVEKENQDNLYPEAVEVVRKEGRASITMLQRKLRIGYTRAARLIDNMEEEEIISPSLPNSQFREVLDYGQTAPPPEDD